MKIESPRDLRIEARRFRILTLYLSGAYTQEEIAEIEGVDRKTVYTDLEFMREWLEKHPRTPEIILQETYIRMVLRSSEVQRRAMAAERDSDAAKLWAVVTSTDSKILERFTQKGLGGTAPDEDGINQAKAAVDFMLERHGPEELQTFLEWYDRRRNAERRQLIKLSEA